MEREVFKSKPLRGLPAGLIRGFLFGCICLFIGLAMGMDEDIFIPLLGVIVVLGGITGVIGNIGKRIEADENGIYLKKKESDGFLGAEEINGAVRKYKYGMIESYQE